MTVKKIEEAREKLRAEMKAHPNKPYGIGEIGRRFGIPKHFIDRQQALSYDGSQIHRSETKDGGIRWTYVPDGTTSIKPTLAGAYRSTPQQVSETLGDEGYFDAASDEDERKKRLQEVTQRRGQPRFRKRLFAAYGGRCAVTGCDAEAALEAAHILPYRGEATNHLSNGLLLRADIHTLFDLNLIGIEPGSLTIVLAESLQGTCYNGIDGKALKLPKSKRSHPSREALERRWKEFV